MGKVRSLILAFNRGLVSKLGLARIDVRRLGFSAEIMTNWMPRVLGSMMLRPGLQHLEDVGSTEIIIPFVFDEDETALICIAEGSMFVLIDDEMIERPTVTAVISNGFFTTDLTGWTDSDESGATSEVGSSSTNLEMTGTGSKAAIIKQEVTVNETSTEHALILNVIYGPIVLRVGSTDGDDDYIAETALDTGSHNLAFTPSGNFHITLSNRLEITVQLLSIAVDDGGLMTVGTQSGIMGDFDDLENVRWDQSGDVIYLASRGKHQRKIERRGKRSWSMTIYDSQAGPFRLINNTDITMAPAALTGTTTVTASRAFFESGHVGSMIRIASLGQNVSKAVAAENTFTDPIRVVGVGDARIFNLDITGTFSATVTLQYSLAEPGSWADLATTYTGATDTTIDDGLDNQIVYYRLGVKTGDFTSGTATCVLAIASGSINGIARIISASSSVLANVHVVRPFGATTASRDWWEGAWSGKRGWPSAVGLHEGRLFWAGKDRIWGSVSDDFHNFDDETVGDAGPINRTIGAGPIDNINWMLSMERLMMGYASNSANVPAAIIDGNSPVSVQSSALDEPLTPSNFNIKSTDATGLFVDRSELRLYQLVLDGGRYVPVDLNLFAPDMNDTGTVATSGIKRIAVQMKPDVRVHCVRKDGNASVLVFDRAEGVKAWVMVETDGEIEDVAVLPGAIEDQVYYLVNRGSNTLVEKWAIESECQGGTLNKQADSFLEYSGSSTSTITGLTHLEGETVVAWGSGKDLGEYTVASGSITLSEAVTSCIVGLKYTAKFKSTKLATIDGHGLCERRFVSRLGVIMRKSHYQGLQYGPDFDNLYDLPKIEGGKATADDTVWDDYDEDTFPFGGEWNTDSRICLQAVAPKPCTLLAAVADIDA